MPPIATASMRSTPVAAGSGSCRSSQPKASSMPITRSPARSSSPKTVETSLAENTIRAAMHPADQFVAMASLIDGGATIEDVARRFGSSERHVRQRLRLGKLAPQLLDAYRGG